MTGFREPQDDVAVALARSANRPKRVDQVMIEPDPHLPVRLDGPGRAVGQGRSYGLERGLGDRDCEIMAVSYPGAALILGSPRPADLPKPQARPLISSFSMLLIACL